jgi:hypothetical protein
MSHGVFVRIELGPFARSGIEAVSEGDVASAVEDALERYAARLPWREEIPPPPRRLLEHGARGADQTQAFVVTVDARTKAALEVEAQRQEVTMDEILRHAVSIYLAEMDVEPGPGGGGDAVTPSAPLSGLTS